ncbi:MAG TPA: DUF1580 domain-containing protein [Gemmataceae bacterium]|nr:DUF1580 domain-containing protein [Gemmataceae bacterium]
MTIDPLSDNTLSLSQAARRLPRLRAGRPVHVTTVWRWALNGVRGVKLETAMVGGVRVTSEEALLRFFAAVGGAATSPGPSGPPATGRTNARARHDEAVERELDAEGL